MEARRRVRVQFALAFVFFFFKFSWPLFVCCFPVSTPIGFGMVELPQGEIYALQAGFWSPDRSTSIFIDGPNGVQWSSLSLPATQGAVEIPASKITCYNTRGVDYRGDSFVQDVSVPAGGVGSLWFSVDVGPFVFSLISPTDCLVGVL